MQVFARLVILAMCIGGIIVIISFLFMMQGDWATTATLLKPGVYLVSASIIGYLVIYAYAAIRK